MRLQGVYSFDRILNTRSSRAYKSINSSEETGCIARCTSPFLEDNLGSMLMGRGMVALTGVPRGIIMTNSCGEHCVYSIGVVRSRESLKIRGI